MNYCLDCDPYAFYVGDGLDPCAFEWSYCFGEDNPEPDMSCQDPLEASTRLDTLNPSVVSVQGQLKQHENFWLNELEPSSFIAGIITEDYCLPFLRLPDPLFQLNHRSALENASFVGDAIDELVLGCCVIECTSCPIFCSPLSVVTTTSGKQRLVLDLRYINQFLPDQKFKYEGLELVPTLLQSGDFFHYLCALLFNSSHWQLLLMCITIHVCVSYLACMFVLILLVALLSSHCCCPTIPNLSSVMQGLLWGDPELPIALSRSRQ